MSHPMRQVMFVEELHWKPGCFLVSLECGHKKATRERGIELQCTECPDDGKKLGSDTTRVARLKAPFAIRNFSRRDKSIEVAGFGLTIRVDFDDVDQVETHRALVALVAHLNAHPPATPLRLPGVHDPDDGIRDAARDLYWQEVQKGRQP